MKYGLWIAMFIMASCSDFLEPKSQSEYVPKLVKSLDELLLGEVYMGPGYSDGRLYGVLGLFDDDVSVRPDWQTSSTEESKVNKLRLAYTWSKYMKDDFGGYNTYGEVYKKILGCNSVLDYIDEVQGSEEEKSRVMAQALGLRGYFYFHLINLYGKPYFAGKDTPGVPLKLTADLGEDGMPRNSVGEVYGQIVKDLLEAERLFKTLPDEEWGTQKQKIRMNLPCVQLLLSRVYLYMENWEQALAYGEKVTGEYNYGVKDLNEVPQPAFWMTPYMEYYRWDNPEIIFLFGNQGDVLDLPMTMIHYSGDKGYTTYYPMVASDDLINSYVPADLRKERYLMAIYENYAPTRFKRATSKFKSTDLLDIEVSWSAGKWGVGFKVTEAYLNAAEAAAMLYKETGKGEFQIKAQTLLDKLRVKRFAPAAFEETDIAEADGLVDFVRAERRRELCFENHRWFDLRRYGMEEIRHVWRDGLGNETEYVLEKNDPGFTLQLPKEAFVYNPSLVQNEERK
ncbi:RagB/SusD family nutrient uptake outer membrane protein [Butyricimonas synergistica]|uniref:RagB/SusD family nutrient uptake outer membrane protein n=1 Tax=Butyricimonas synergistica TaxID=544644 RepID=UPI00037A0AF1|nr:RagB/SusD family nutrient uptake outer membrane protein [Butyricimonas synergistica]